jgi:hypothetical protein
MNARGDVARKTGQALNKIGKAKEQCFEIAKQFSIAPGNWRNVGEGSRSSTIAGLVPRSLQRSFREVQPKMIPNSSVKN